MRKLLWLLPVLLLAGCVQSKRTTMAPPAVPRPDSGENRKGEAGAEMLRVFNDYRTPPGGALNTERYLTAKEHAAAMPRAANLGTWVSLGPSTIGGRTRSLVINPANTNIMYAGAISGGVWKTTDGGNSWLPLTDNQLLPFICTLAMDPTNPNIIYAGTGESFGVDYQGIRGLGILKTIDGGNTWTRLSTTAIPDFYYVNKIRISPLNSSHLYAATSTGVFRSLDAGASWSQVLAAPPAGSSATVPGCQDLAIRSDMPGDYVYASCVGGFFLPGGIWRNTDAAGAGTWTNVETLPGVVRIGLALAPSSQNIIYAITAVGSNGSNAYINALGAVLRSTSNGDPGTWLARTSNADPTLLNTLLLNYPLYSCGGPTADSQKVGQGAYDMDIEVDPTNANTVWVGGIDIFRSNDGGANWGIAGFFDAAGTGAIHADQHMIVFHPQWNGTSNQTLYVMNDGGVWRTTNANAAVLTGTNALCASSNGSYTGAAIAWTKLVNGYVTTQFYHGAVYPGGGAYVGGTQDNGGLRGDPVHGPSSWTTVSGGDSAVWRIDPVDQSVFYGEGPGLSLLRFSLGGHSYASVTNGITEFTAAYAPYILDPNDSRRIYLGGNSHLWRSDNQGDTWSSVTTGGAVYINAVAVSPADSNRVVFGDQNGNLAWTSSALSPTPTTGWSSSRPRTGVVSAIAFHPSDPNIVFAAYSTFDAAPGDNHIYKSVDGGRSWTGIDGAGPSGLPDIPVSSIVIDPQNPSAVYLGTDLGIFVSTDGGNSWSHDDSSFADTIITALALDRGAGVANLYAFTFGRGVWRVTLAGGGVPCSYSVSPTTAVSDAAGSLNSVQVNTGVGCAWSAQYVSGNVRLMPPASGVGPGRVYYTLDHNDFTGAPRDGGVFNVQGTQVHVTSQASIDAPTSNDTAATAQHITTLPYHGGIFSAFTSDPSDPIHSCTGSRDFQTAWWSFTAPSDGAMVFTARSARTDGTTGEGGFTITAYPSTSVSAASELGCYTRPRTVFTGNQLFPDEAGFTFNVRAGISYVLEVSSTTNGSSFDYFTVAYSTGTGSISITPVAVALSLDGKQQFTAQTTNLISPVVRWSISPAIGSIDVNGVYTAPPSLTAPTNVKVTAVSVADNTVQAFATVALTVAPVAIGAVTNAASFLVDAVSPGEMVTLFGNGLGPATLVGAQLAADGTVATAVSQTQVFFDGIAAPIIYVLAGQTTVMVPYEVAGKTSTQVVAVYQGQKSAPLTVPVAQSAPGIFTQDGRQGSILNVNNDGTVTLNTTNSRAPAGTLIEVYATGEGQTSPPGSDGVLNNGPTLPKPLLPVTVMIGGKPAQVTYAGAAPQGVAGFMQLNVVIPSGLSPGAQSLVLAVGPNMSPAVVTVWVK